MGIFDFFKKKSVKGDMSIGKNNIEENMIKSRMGNVQANSININSKTVEQMHRCFIAFDVETTGLNADYDRIIELGAVKFIDGKPADKFSTLINPKVSIPKMVSNVNHITNEMISTAPTEEDVYPKFIEFLGSAVTGKIIMCAHNARFDFNFLGNTLRRLGYDAEIVYADTLSLSRKYIHGLENYKLGTLEKHLGLTNNNQHRAESDALICGEILCNVLYEMDTEINEQRKCMEKNTPNDEELEICGFIQNIIRMNGGDTSWLRYRRNSSNYIDVMCLYSFLKFKIAKKGKYLIVDKGAVENIKLSVEACTYSEGGENNVRVFFDSPFELECLTKYINECFNSTFQSMHYYIDESDRALNLAKEGISMFVKIEDAEIPNLLDNAQNRIEENQKKIVELKLEEERKQKEKTEKQRSKEEKKKEKAEEIKQKRESKQLNSTDKKSKGRPVIQMTDEQELIKEYNTVAEAVRETGINSKSIRDAAKGVQKHAGGFCWKYKDEIED